MNKSIIKYIDEAFKNGEEGTDLSNKGITDAEFNYILTGKETFKVIELNLSTS